MTIVTLVSGCGNAYRGEGTRDGGGQGGRWVGQHTDAADRVRAIGYCHREIGEHPPRRMSRERA